MNPILVTGGSGQLATALRRWGESLPQDRIQVVGRPEFDFDKPETLDAAFAAITPSIVVNAAAWTAVDAAESEPEAAMRANRDGPARLAALCDRAGIPIIHVSTDYVYDGRKGSAYVETDPTGPTGVYGASKLAGEHAVLEACEQAVILRTSWVYSSTGKNFVRTMLELGKTRDALRVVSDQKGCPTAASDLAHAILHIADQVLRGWDPRYRGVFHIAGSGSTTWFGLAEAVFEQSARHGARWPVVDPIPTSQYPTPARRPPDSRLNCAKLRQVFGLKLPDWRSSLARTIDELMVPAGPHR